MKRSGLQEVRVTGLSKVFDEEYALVDVNAAFVRGTVTALLGPNGAGKSTLISILSTLMRPSEGCIEFDGRAVDIHSAEVRALIGYVGHRIMLYRALTARENLQFFGRLYALSELESHIDRLLERVGLQHAADRPIVGFSRGMAQRLTIARALLPEPNFLLLDEPFTGLDQDGIDMAVSMFGEERARGAIVLLASHDLPVVERLADHVLVLRRGRNRFQGALAGNLGDVYRHWVVERQAS